MFSLTKRPIKRALSINPLVYKSKKIFKEEFNSIFKNSWVPIGYTNQFTKHNIIPSYFGNKPIIMTKNRENEISAFYNVCRHRGCKLVDKEKTSNLIVCPYHSWSYKLDGDLFKTPMYKPNKTEFDKEKFGLFPLKIDTVNNMIFASDSESDLPPAKKFYHGASQDLSDYPLQEGIITHQKKYTVNCNWKLLVDNFIEYYHLPAVHPELTQVSGVDNHHCTQKDGQYIGFITNPITNNNSPLDYDFLPPMKNIPEKNKKMAIFHAIFPNQFYFLFPNHMFSIILQPVSASKTIEHAVLISDADNYQKYPDKVDEIWDFYDMVNIQDLKICEKVQEGIECDDYLGGKLVPKYEDTIHRFHQMLINCYENN
jgi:choline monooxygenase